MGRILLFAAVTAIGLLDQAITRPTIPISALAPEEVSFVEDVSLEIAEPELATTPVSAPLDFSQVVTPLVVPEVIPAGPPEDLLVATTNVVALPCADGSCRSGPLRALATVVKERPHLFQRAHENAVERRNDRRDRWANRPGLFGRRIGRRC